MALDLEDVRSSKPGLMAWFGFSHAELLRSLPAGIVGALAGFMVAARFGAPFALSLVAGLLGFALAMLGVRLIAGGAAEVVAGAVLPRGGNTPPRADYSREDALLMQRDIAGALASFEQKIAADPTLVDARLRAANLHAASGGDLRRAEALFKEVQRAAGVSRRDDVHASNRLVDLYDGPLADPGRAMVELRRLIERHPGTRAADDARRGLATLKARQQRDT